MDSRGTYLAFKRFADVMGASVGLILTGPLMLAMAAAIRLTLGSPVLFRQERTGWRERSFWCWKFRTMTDACDEAGRLLSDEERTPPFGRFLRRTSLDELPQLWNILRGDISFVGPRPFVVENLPYYTPEERRRHSIRPGLTGWAQVNGRNHLSFGERIALDLWYVDRLSPALDFSILLRTVWIVLTQRGCATDSMTLIAERTAGQEGEQGAKAAA